MGKSVGAVGKHAGHQAANRKNGVWVTAALSLGGLGCVAGLMLGSALPQAHIPGWGSLPIAAGFAGLMMAFAQWCLRQLDQLELDWDRELVQTGAVDELAVEEVLGSLPAQFRVIHDLTTSCGNIDFAVVGPTGVFLLDTKNWRGVVAGDGQGELTLNGQPLHQPYVGRFVARVLDLKETVRARASGPDAYFEAVFVFTSARVDAGIGTTGDAHCIRGEHLFDYIVKKRFGRRLPPAEVAQLTRAMQGLTAPERDFTEDSDAVATAFPA